MDKGVRIINPRYQQIATDIASKIASKYYSVGDKIYARSSIASQYGVSPETARRAISVLADLGIVETEIGNGVKIKSYEKAVNFVNRYHDIQTVNSLKKDIQGSMERQTKEFEFFNDCLTKLIEKTDRFRSINPFTPFEIEITQETSCLHQTVSETNFWHNTTATIVAIKRENKLFLSPGPYSIFLPGDIVYFIGDENCFERVRNFLYPENVEN
ncbi:TrkA C-terminal domain-containing protein [Ruminiclostridium cellulolyticum]|uniref:TrkA-C domain protein n=1 Tax=Ruminiclostridium cellulolyticum (strain ATCC 35319 / DSM 5812 / JCM 6584 / H10) TaxID=394503 RepID=B8I1I9_RUMCH|nr:TrkA C-terminal domain-containing protein [Ruminiclostridium cellulolyticum]ACL77624.1 TrkA-C domain protein [Ruminiclostridium cellulolyticum H10]